MTKEEINEELNDWINTQKVIDALHISKRTLQRWHLDGLIPYSKIGGRYYYKKSDINDLLMRYYNGEGGGEY